MRTTIKVKLDPGAKLPTRAHAKDAGLDIYAAEDAIIRPGCHAAVETGVHVEIPAGYVGLLTSKSGLMNNHGLTCRGTIDADYTGSIKAVMFNDGSQIYSVQPGDKITQLVILPIITPELEVVDELPETERGADGFGSTGR